MTIKWREVPPKLCELEECQNIAVGWVEAQWSLFDFVRYEGCEEHLEDMRARLAKRKVEEFLPITLVHWYEE